MIEAFALSQVQRVIAYVPKTPREKRTYVLSCLILDTGVRIAEALSVERADIDIDNLLIRIRHGKGAKERVVPISLQMRRVLFRYMDAQKPRFNQRNALRDFKRVCSRLSIEGPRCSFHTLRHTFAINYIRQGGDVFRLQHILGHTKLEMTRRYVNLQTEDLKDVHQRISLMNLSR